MRAAAIVVAVIAAGVTAAPAGAATTRCATTTVNVTAGSSATLRLDCVVKRHALIRGAKAGARRTLALKPRSGRLSSFDGRRGTVRYTPKAGFTGRDKLEFRIKLKSGRKLAGTIVIRVLAKPTPQPAPQPSVPSDPPPAPPSIAFGTRNWQPTAQDTCPRSLHEQYSVIGPDGKRYPAWHPPAVVDPATGRECTFGHEHGRDPHGSDIYDWVAQHFAAPGKERFAGIPFGQATEALESYPGAVKRQEDHVGYKIEYANDVPLTNAQGALGVSCDYLVRVHQGSHSPDALSNNVHELLYAVRCTDGTELISNVVARFGAPGAFTRSCDPATTVATANNGYPAGPGARLIPDRACMEAGFLVPPGRTTTNWAT